MKLPFWATILSVAGFIFLCYMGIWQLNRLHWKSGILRAIETEYSHDAAEKNLSEFLKDQEYFEKEHGIRRGYLEGQFIHEKSILLGPRVHNKIAGYHLISPFRLKGANKYLLVNRGWVPQGYDIHKGILAQGAEKITGILMATPKDNAFVPDNNPDKEEWFRIDLAQISTSRSLDNLYDLTFYLENHSLKKGQYPAPADNFIRPNNNHMQYAVFWFIMALALVVVYGLRFARIPKTHGPHVDEF